MTEIKVTLSDDRFARLEKVAAQLHLKPEDLVRASLDSLLDEGDEDVARAMEYVLAKNAELYRRLA